MKRFKQILLVAAVAVAPMLFTSCSNDNSSYDGPAYYGYATLGTNLSTQMYWFIDDDGKTYMPTLLGSTDSYTNGYGGTNNAYSILDSDGKDKNGRRVFIYFNLLTEPLTGYDYNIKLYSVVDILSKDVEKATTAAELEAFGDDKIRVNQATINGDWLDVYFTVNMGSSTTHRVSLVDTTPSADVEVPEGYTYLEMRQKTTGTAAESTEGAGYVSFKLGDNYSPSKTGKKGFYIRVNNLNGSVEYLTLTYKKNS